MPVSNSEREAGVVQLGTNNVPVITFAVDCERRRYVLLGVRLSRCVCVSAALDSTNAEIC